MKPDLPKILRCAFALAAIASLFAFSSHACTAAPQSLNAAFEVAVRRNDLAQIKSLLKKGANPNYRQQYQITALMDAAMDSRLGAAQVLLAAGADPNLKDNGGTSVLMYAAKAGSYSIARLLLERKVDVNADEYQVPHDMTALLYAASSGNPQLVQLLIDHGANVNFKTNDGETALMFVKGASCAKILINHGADVNANTHEFADTVLMRAVDRGDVGVIKTLLAHGVDVNAQGARGSSALEYAIGEHHSNIVKLLKQAGEVQ